MRARDIMTRDPQCCRREAELRRELRLAETHLGADLAHIDFGHVDKRDPNVLVFAARPRDGLL